MNIRFLSIFGLGIGAVAIAFFAAVFILWFFAPLPALGAAGVRIISYQGRLTNANGDLLGSNGTTFYFKFSLHSATSGGTKLWPEGTPCTHSLNVKQGVFNANIGDVLECPDTLDFDFISKNAIWLEVRVSSDNVTFETLSPRQRVNAAAFALVADTVIATSTQSRLGTTSPISTSLLTIEATTTSVIPLSIRASPGQVADLFKIQNAAGADLFTVSGYGAVGIASSTPGAGFGVATSTYIIGGLGVGRATTTDGVLETVSNAIIGGFLNVSGNATSTFNANGVNLRGGCFAINGACVGAGTINSGSINRLAYYSGGTALDSANFLAVNAASSLFGVGSTTPWGALSVQSTVDPIVVIATSSGATAILSVTSTSTGALDHARIGIGVNTASGSGGIRDQLTVAGRIYSTWRYLSCDFFGADMIGLNIVADTAHVCGPLAFDEDSDGQLNNTADGNPGFTTIKGGAATPSAGEGSAIRTWYTFVAATSSPTTEVMLRISNFRATTTKLYMIGFTDIAGGGDTATLPSNGIFFAASSTNNWIAVVRSGNNETRQDTGVATSTTAFQKLRIEVTPATVYFLIDGDVVAQISTNIPAVNMALAVSAAITTGGSSSAALDIASIRLWIDDPPSGEKTSGEPAKIFQQLDLIRGADIAEAYLVGDPWQFSEGKIVVNEDGGAGKVKLAQEPYDPDMAGAISTSPYMVMGMSAENTVEVGLLGRVPVAASLINGPIRRGDRITSSVIPGIGMRASRPGYVLGRALEGFNPAAGIGTCDDSLAETVSSVVVSGEIDLAGAECAGIILVDLRPGFDLGIGNMIRQFKEGMVTAVSAVDDLADEAFETGAELIKLTAGKIVTQTAVIKNLFAKALSVLPGGTISLPEGVNQIVGEDVLPVGATSILVHNNKVASTSKIFITPLTVIDHPLAVSEVRAGEGFIVSTAIPVSQDTIFSWMIIYSYRAAEEASAAVPAPSP